MLLKIQTLKNYESLLFLEDRSVIFLITLFSSAIVLMLIYGVMKNKPSYLMPYFSIKIFQVLMSCLTTLGFYSCLPNVRVWIQNHTYFPYKNTLLVLDNHTLELFAFSFLLSTILIKLYTCIIVWYCYRYMLTMQAYRNGGVGGSHCRSTTLEGSTGINFDDNNFNSEFKIDDETLINKPPKYEDVVGNPLSKKRDEKFVNLNSTDSPRTSRSIGSNDIVHLPSYSSFIERQNEQNIV